MNHVKLLIADDESHAREAISRMVELYCDDVEIVAQASGVAEAIKAIEEHEPDVLLLDINLQDGTGFDIVSHFKNPKFKVVFITAYQEYALQAFRFSALDYILKPVDPDMLAAAVNRAREMTDTERMAVRLDTFIHNMGLASKAHKKIVLNTQETIHVISIHDIVRLEADKNYTRFFIVGQKPILVSRSLIEYDEMLQAHGFFRSHHSHLINLAFVDRYEKRDGGKLMMKDGSEAPVSVRRKEELLAVLSRI